MKFFLLPSGLTLLALGLGLLLILARRTRRTGVGALGLGAFIYVVFGSGPVAFWLMEGLEDRYATLADPAVIERPVDYIVVLAAYGEVDERAPPGNQVNRASIFRLLEAMRLHQARPEAIVVLTGREEVPALMRESLLVMGMPADRVMLESESRNTHDSAVHLRDRLEDRQFILVTSAGHMARSVRAFEKQGLQPIPAPTDFLSRRQLRLSSWLPTPGHLGISDQAMHEYLGMAWYRLRGRN